LLYSAKEGLFQQTVLNNICDWISYNLASTHTKSSLQFYQKWIVQFHSALYISLKNGWSTFCSSFFPDLVEGTSGQLAPISGHGFDGMVYNELGLHRELAISDITQFGVI